MHLRSFALGSSTFALFLSSIAACSAPPDGDTDDSVDDAISEAAKPACESTRITYGSAWIHGADHEDAFDDAKGLVTWDGRCLEEGSDSVAVLSNGWKPRFHGHGTCVIALDTQKGCKGAPTSCSTRVAYGSSWQAPKGHDDRFDDVGGRVFASGDCETSGSTSSEGLSNGWRPVFSGKDACSLGLRYTQCGNAKEGGLYTNPVFAHDAPDPGVIFDGIRFVMTHTSGRENAFPIYVSDDLVHWSRKGEVFPADAKLTKNQVPAWAKENFWAPEIHKVGADYVAYYTARQANGVLAIGVAWAPAFDGPYEHRVPDAPLISDPDMGLIDASELNDGDTHYVLWKEDGNAVGKPTPIHIQRLSADGRSLAGTRHTLITNDLVWEGKVVEGPFMVKHGDFYYLFYAGNGYGSAKYGVGVARSKSPLGPFVKHGAPIFASNAAWEGPGHCSVVDTPAGDTYVVAASWEHGHTLEAPGREIIVDRIRWVDGWPTVPFGPSATSRPVP